MNHTCSLMFLKAWHVRAACTILSKMVSKFGNSILAEFCLIWKLSCIYIDDKAFWQRITEYYNKHPPAGIVERIASRVKSNFYKFYWQVNDFSVYYNNWYNNRGSGWSGENVLEKTHEQSRKSNQKRLKFFKYKHAWRIFKESEKFVPQPRDYRAAKKMRNKESGAYTSSSNLDMSA